MRDFILQYRGGETHGPNITHTHSRAALKRAINYGGGQIAAIFRKRRAPMYLCGRLPVRRALHRIFRAPRRARNATHLSPIILGSRSTKPTGTVPLGPKSTARSLAINRPRHLFKRVRPPSFPPPFLIYGGWAEVIPAQ